jgi:hypothetical protein
MVQPTRRINQLEHENEQKKKFATDSRTNEPYIRDDRNN